MSFNISTPEKTEYLLFLTAKDTDTLKEQTKINP